MKENLSIKEQNFVTAYLETGNIAQSAKIAGSKGKDTASLHQVGRQILERIGFSLKEIQEAKGITDSFLTDKLSAKLNSQKRYYGSWQGQIVASEPFDDDANQLKALEIAHRLRGQFIDKTEITGADGGDLILQLAPSKSKKDKKRSVSFE